MTAAGFSLVIGKGGSCQKWLARGTGCAAAGCANFEKALGSAFRVALGEGSVDWHCLQA
jgi:hypothetical protein